MIYSTLSFGFLGLGASLVNAIPNANYLIPRPPETVTITACSYQCSSTVTVTETFIETAPYFFTCEPSSTPVTTGTLGSLTLSPSIISPPPFTPITQTTKASSSTVSQASGTAPGFNLSSSIETIIQTSTPRVTVSSQLPSARTPSSSFIWTVNSTSSRDRSSSSSYGTGTAGTSVTSAMPSLSSTLGSNSTKPITRTITRTVRTTDTGSSTTVAEVTITTIPSIGIPPPPVTVTKPLSTASPGSSYSVTTYTTVMVINTTVSSQLPGASTLSRSASRTTMRTTVVVTITNTIPLSTGTGQTSANSGSGVSSRFPSLSSSISIRLSNSLSYGTTSTSALFNTTSTVVSVSTELASSTEAATKSAASTFSSKVPCATNTRSVLGSSAIPGTTASGALPSLAISTSTSTPSTMSDGYGFSASSLGTKVDSAKPSFVSSSTSNIPGGYGSEYSTSSPGTIISGALPSLITSSISSMPAGYEDYPSYSKDSTAKYSGTTIASALPSLVTPSVSKASPMPTTFETRKSDEYISTSTAYTGYEYGYSP
ncbi:hypothetical protein CI238_05747 [Colletotrichum incanum]|uniref:Uncharacterized protein n=1 Tax=Colletotrichum incanum TaxID=1573173 RepID=A0A162NDN0_COLIC|nr:hypothetical protein CI238_05747 [Colletotrichum incanum]OHW89752.1 hypothetical protein CSPAE12_11673 [Colletotrichum incanum]